MMESSSAQSPASSSSAAAPLDIETIRMRLANNIEILKSRVSLSTLRPLPVFLGLQEAGDGVFLSQDAFAPPNNLNADALTKIKSRVKENLSFFLTNYCLIVAMVAVVVALMHPVMLISLGIVYGLWKVHEYLLKNEVVLGSIRVHEMLTVTQRSYLLSVISAIIIVFMCLVPTLIVVSISGFIILCHASLRDTQHLRDASERATSRVKETNETDALLSKV